MAGRWGLSSLATTSHPALLFTHTLLVLSHHDMNLTFKSTDRTSDPQRSCLELYMLGLFLVLEPESWCVWCDCSGLEWR